MTHEDMFDQWIQRLARAVGYDGRVIDLTRPGAGVTVEERRALGLAAGVLAGKVINLDVERARRKRVAR